jgi:hypothetical protein
MDQLKATETNNTDYAQHIQKHVREVRRRNVKAPKAPELEEFQETVNDKTSTQWFSFIQAVRTSESYESLPHSFYKQLFSGLNILLVCLHTMILIDHWSPFH